MDTRELTPLADEDNTEKFGEATLALFKTTPIQESTTDWGRWSRPAPPGAVSRRKVSLWRFAWNEIRRNPGRLAAMLMVAAAAGVWTYNIYTPHTFEMRLETPGSTTHVTVTAPATPRTTTRPLHRGAPQPIQTPKRHPATSSTTLPKTSAAPRPTHIHTHSPAPTQTASAPPVQSKSPEPRPTDTATVSKSATATSSCTSTSGSPCP